MRIWREHLRPRIGLLAARLASPCCSPRRPPAPSPSSSSRTADDVFVGQEPADGLLGHRRHRGGDHHQGDRRICRPTSPSPISATASSPISASRCSPSSPRADLSWIQTVHSGRLLSSFLNDAMLIRADGEPLLVTLGENYLKVIILIATMFYMDARFAVLILIFMPFAWFLLGAPAAQDAEIDHQVAAGDRRPLGADHPDLARHARRARLPAGGPRGERARLPPSTARSNSPCAARAPARCRARRSSS